MRTIDITEDLREYNPEAGFKQDPRLQETVELLDELDLAAKETIIDFKRTAEFISKSSESTENRLSYLQQVHGASNTYWTIVTTTLMALLGWKMVQGGTALFKWVKRIKGGGNGKDVSQSQPRKRLHARQWSSMN